MKIKKFNEQLLNKVYQLKKFNLDKDLNYSLTINYIKIVNDFKYQKLNLVEIENHIKKFDGDITSYNLSITNRDRYDEKRYDSYWFDYDIIITSGELLINFTSRFLQLPYYKIKDNSIENALQLIIFYKDKSKEIWDKVI